MLRRLRVAEHLEIFEVRRALEVEAARLAASRATEEDIEEIKAALDKREQAWAERDSAAFVETDLAFHIAVVAATHNRVLIDIYNDFSAALRASITAAGVPLEKTYISHDAIYQAIAAGDVQAAERAGLECMEHILASLKKSTESNG